MADRQQRLWHGASFQSVSAAESIPDRLVRYYLAAGSPCSVREPDLWPSIRSSATTVQELMLQLRSKDVLVPAEFGLYVLIPDEESTVHAEESSASGGAASTSDAPARPARTRWAPALDLPHGILPPGPVLDIRVVAAPAKSSDQHRSFQHRATDYIIVLTATGLVLAALFGLNMWIKPWSMYQDLKVWLKDVLELVGVIAFGVAVLGFPAWVLGKLLTADAAKLFLGCVFLLILHLVELAQDHTHQPRRLQRPAQPLPASRLHGHHAVVMVGIKLVQRCVVEEPQLRF